ncbi:3964_t:CDS:2, partial [Paraglomus occultum]
DLLASKGAEIVYVDYDQHDNLVNALKGTDALISTVAPARTATVWDFDALQTPLLDAAKAAGVKRFIPSEFGIDYRVGDHPVSDTKASFREKVQNSGLEYTIILCGLFAEFLGWFAFDVKNKTATFLVDGSTKLAVISLSDVAKFTAESLKLNECRNTTIRVIGSSLPLNEILKNFEQATGSKWKVIEDKDAKHRFQNKIDPIPSPMDMYKIVIVERSLSDDNIDNDKFSFSPRPLIEDINVLVKQT